MPKPKLRFALTAIAVWIAVFASALMFGTKKELPTAITMPTRVATTQPTTTTSTSTTTTTTTVVQTKRKKGKCPNYEELFRQYGLEPVATFSYIAWRESRCTPTAMNTTLNRDGSFDSGLLQINSTWKSVTRQTCGGDLDLLLDLDCNLRVAKYLLDNGGLGHWGIDD